MLFAFVTLFCINTSANLELLSNLAVLGNVILCSISSLQNFCSDIEYGDVLTECTWLDSLQSLL